MRIGRFLKRRLERRRSPRIDGEDLVAYYWTGAIQSPRDVRQIGLYGAQIVAPDGFYPGTLVQIVFEDRATNGHDGSPHPHICVYAKTLRRVADGFCVVFLFSDAAERRRFRRFLEHLKRRAGGNNPDAVECRPDAEDQDGAKGGDETDIA